MRAAKLVDGQRALARILGVEPPTVNQWTNRTRPVPDDKCVAIELATAGEIGCEELAPERRWVRIPDPQWPHPKGRPLIDLAPANDAAEARA